MCRLIFQKQITADVPVTASQMACYFITIPEAVQLVLQTAVLRTSGEVFLLNMGKPIKIIDSACDLIRVVLN